MCVGTSTAIALAVGAGASLGSAAISSHAAGKAADTQTKAAKDALNFQQTQYNQARQDFDPYKQAGSAAVGRLGGMATTPTPTFQPGSPTPRFGNLGNPAGAGMPSPSAPGAFGMSQPGQPQAGGGAMWTLKAPDGSTRQYPPDVAQQFMSRGAIRVG